MPNAELGGKRRCDRRLVVGSTEGDGVGRQIARIDMPCCKRSDRRRVESAGQHHPDRDVADERRADCVVEQAAQLRPAHPDPRASRSGARARPSTADLERTPEPTRTVAGRQLANVLEQVRVAEVVAESQDTRRTPVRSIAVARAGVREERPHLACGSEEARP